MHMPGRARLPETKPHAGRQTGIAQAIHNARAAGEGNMI